MDVFLIVNVVEGVKRGGKKGVICKSDFEKMCDTVSWELLDKVFDRKGFGIRWRYWLLWCFFIFCFLIIIKGRFNNLFGYLCVLGVKAGIFFVFFFVYYCCRCRMWMFYRGGLY